jgi:hypothetical protein
MRGGREEVRPIDASRVEIVGASFLFQSILSVTILFLSFSLSRGSNRKHDVVSGRYGSVSHSLLLLLLFPFDNDNNPEFCSPLPFLAVRC